MPRRSSISLSVQSATSPSSVASSTANEVPGLTTQETELQKKRARDRKSQQAMRDRNKWTIHTLTDQVSFLNGALDGRVRDIAILQNRLGTLEAENAHLRAQNAALNLSLIRRNDVSSSGEADPSLDTRLFDYPWTLAARNTSPTCIADQILQGFVDSTRSGGASASDTTAFYSMKPKVGALIQAESRSQDDISNVVADVVRAYPEIESLPKKVAVFQNMALLLKAWFTYCNPLVPLG
ncbi:BZIP transcription factor [Colletotrichum karsti]|uniref:BZIP transcription factor n=1 Tax=Colletotrichum karsti TaxID=1095194 RepID=A0A9P6LI46_9PEZI|nr:BZIP transcription factor [Colletotrichum karsti]KAF9874243.1 BZIP transcription factor [Colletotrichum karsti]